MTKHPDSNPRKPLSPLAMCLVLILTFGLVVTYSIMTRGLPESPAGKLHPLVGRQLSLGNLPLLANGEQSLRPEDLQGKVTLVNFWGTWCFPCRIEMPHLIELEQQLRAESRFRFVSISCGQGIDDGGLDKLKAETEAFARFQSIDFPVYSDPGAIVRIRVLDQLNVQSFSYPTTILLDGRQTVQAMWSSYRDGMQHEIRAEVDRLLQGNG